MRVDDDDPHSASWQGIGGDCHSSLPTNALQYIDNVNYLNDIDFDEVGMHRTFEPARDPGWHRPDEHYRGWIPTGPEGERPMEWFQDLATPIPVEQTSGGLWQIAEEALQPIVRDLTSFREALEAVAEHPKYDMYVACPALFDIASVHQSFDTIREVQILGGKAKHAVLEHWGIMAWWTSSVSNWGEGVPENIVARISAWNLLSRPKRGFLVSLPRDWCEMNFGHLIRNGVPLFYLWGLVEDSDPRFTRLDPQVMTAYRDACERKQVRSLWGDEISHMKNEFERCGRYDAFLQWHRNPHSQKSLEAPRLDVHTGRLLYAVKDFDTWSRRALAEDESWELLDQLYHHVVVESEHKQTTTVVFLRFHRKPKGTILTENDEFMDDEVVEPCRTEIRERFKGRCAPKHGQVFDADTGVERSKPLEPGNEVAIRRYDEETFLIPPPDGLGGRLLRGVGVETSYPDTTRLRRSLGPRKSGPDSDHSSERREGDSSRPMAFEGGWAAAMARPDHAGNYRPCSTSPFKISPYLDARSSTSSVQASHPGSQRRSASPDSHRSYPPRQRSPPHFKSISGHPEYMQELLARRADFLDNLREWSAQITHDAVLWRIPLEFGWNMQFLKDGYLIISEDSEMRLCLIALMTPGVRFLRHVLEIGMERGIGFSIGLKSSVCQSYRPRGIIEHRATTKAQLESLDRRLELGSSPGQTHGRWLRLLGDIAALENARAIIARGGAPSWIIRAQGFLGLVQALMSGPSAHVTVYHGGGNDSADEDSLGLRWDELSDNDYQCIYGYVAGPTRDKDTWMYPPDEMLEELCKHYYREWNPVVDDLFRRIKKEWDDRPCRGKLRTRSQWRDFFHGTNHGRFEPEIEVNAAWMLEARSRFSYAFEGSWNKRRIWEIAVPESFKADF
ncbi:hypothetical protein B0H13DRAFT_1874158 [Mycena leptocephala]|nr:hypothetical protein B0H13DRAFT_1874158 [Mycena leptocephala]